VGGALIDLPADASRQRRIIGSEAGPEAETNF